ncbi:unnamed protein product [Calypogeia fissa]
MDNCITAEDEVNPITHWLYVDLLKKNAVLLLQQAIRYLMDGSKMGRIGVLHNLGYRQETVCMLGRRKKTQS